MPHPAGFEAKPVASLATPRYAWCGWDLGDPGPSQPSALPRTLSRARKMTVPTVIAGQVRHMLRSKNKVENKRLDLVCSPRCLRLDTHPLNTPPIKNTHTATHSNTQQHTATHMSRVLDLRRRGRQSVAAYQHHGIIVVTQWHHSGGVLSTPER